MATEFSEALKKLRCKAGYKTAYSFYHRNCGAQVLKISYRKYLALEQGTNLPQFSRLKSIIISLRLVPREPEATMLVVAWLKTMAGKDNYESLLAPILPVNLGGGKTPPMNRAMEHSLAGKKHVLTAEQFKTIADSMNNLLCYLALGNDDGKWLPEELAKHLKITPKDTAASMSALAKVQLLKKDSSGRYKCPLTGMLIEAPQLAVAGFETIKKYSRHLQDLNANGVQMWARSAVMRIDEDDMREHLALMRLSVSAAHSYALTSKTDKSGLYTINSSVIKLRDF